jgi:CRP-like cAMP-binding protein
MIDPSLFREISIFSNLSEEEIQALAQVAELKDYPSGSTLVEPDEVSQKLFFIRSGKVRELIKKVPGWPPIVRTMKEGEMLGGACLFERICPSQELIALTDTKVIEVDKHDFLNVIRGHTELLLGIVEESSLVQPLGDERHFDWIQGDVAHFERWISSELESIKLRYEALEKQATATMTALKTDSQESLKKSEKQIALVLEEGRSELEKNQEEVNEAITKAENKTVAAIQEFHTFRKKVIAVIATILVALGLGSTTAFFMYFKQMLNKIELGAKRAEETIKLKKDYQKALDDMQDVENKFLAMESAASAIHSEIEVVNLWKAIPHMNFTNKEDNLDNLRNLNINMTVNRNKLVNYFKDYTNHNIGQPDALIETLNVFLRLSSDSKEKIKKPLFKDDTDERTLIWDCCKKSLDEFNIKYSDKQDNDWRFNAKARDNLVLFANIMKKDYPIYYKYRVLPDMERFVKLSDLHPEARRSIAQAIAMLYVKDEAAKEVMMKMYEQGKADKNIWLQCLGAACLVRLGDPKAYTYMAGLMDKQGRGGLIAAQIAGEVLMEDGASGLDLEKLNPKKVSNIIDERLAEGKPNVNEFRILYAKELQRQLKDKYGEKFNF